MRAKDLVSRTHERERGSALLMLMIMIPVLIAVGIGISQVLENRMADVRITRAQHRMQLLARRVELAANSRFAVAHSATGALGRCLRNGPCRSNAGLPRPYVLRSPTGEPITGSYGLNGRRCTSEDCPLKVRTWYEARCAVVGTKVCQTPAEVITHYRIEQATPATFGGRRIKPVEGSISIARFSCPADEYVTGVDANGRPVCDRPILSVNGTACSQGAGAGITEEGRLVCRVIQNYCRGDLSLVLVMDTSGSMAERTSPNSPDTKIAGSKGAGADFIEFMRGADQFGLVRFATASDVVQDLTGEESTLKDKIKTLGARGATNMTAGLADAAALLNQVSSPTSLKTIVFLSDGMHNVGPGPLAMADKLKADGIRIWAIGFGKNADQNLLRKLASTPDDYQYAATSAELKNLFSSIASVLCRTY